MTSAARTVVENEPFTGLAEEDSRFLQRRLGGRLQARRGSWVISRVVGHIVMPSGVLLRVVSRKATAIHLLTWLTYVDSSLRTLRADATHDKLGSEGDFAVLLVRLFLHELLATVERHGLTMQYQRTSVRGSDIRGSIDFRRLLAEGHDLSRVHCAVWARAPDTALNRVLSAALRRIGVDPALRVSAGEPLMVAQRHFQRVSSAGVEAALQRNSPLARTEEPYRTAYEAARLILRMGGLGDGATHRGFAFLIDLERLFEAAVQRAFADSSAFVECERQARVYYTRRAAGTAERAAMFVDVLCRTPDRLLAVDAKFKHDVSAANIQQMATYCYLTGAQSGALVLPGDTGDDGEIELVPATASPLRIRVLHLATAHTTLAGWRGAAADLVRRTLDS